MLNEDPIARADCVVAWLVFLLFAVMLGLGLFEALTNRLIGHGLGVVT